MSLAAQIHEQNVPKYKTLLAIIKTILEFLVICLLIYGYTKEDKIAQWERKQIKRIKSATRHGGACVRKNKQR